jgi:D-aspartate ligase
MAFQRKQGENVGGVVLGGDFQGLGLAHSLVEKEVPVFLVEHEWSIGHFSRIVKRKEQHFGLLNGGNFADYLIDLAEREGLHGWVLFPNNDEEIKLLSLNHEKLDGVYRNPIPPWETVRKFYDKRSAYEIAEDLSIPIPRMYRGKTLDDLLGQNLEFPLVLKPTVKEGYFTKTKKKAVKVSTREALITEFQGMASIIDSSKIIVQEMIEGGPKNLFSYVAAFDGTKSIAGMSARRLRQHPMDFGQATTYAESVTIPELETLGNKILKGVGFYGLAEVEFMWDEKAKCFKFIEINGRVWGWHTLAKAAGVNLPFIWFQHVMGDEIEVQKAVEGVKWVRPITDLPTVFREMIHGRMSVTEYIASMKGKKEFVILSSGDFLPFLIEYIMIPYLWWKRGF